MTTPDDLYDDERDKELADLDNMEAQPYQEPEDGKQDEDA